MLLYIDKALTNVKFILVAIEVGQFICCRKDDYIRKV